MARKRYPQKPKNAKRLANLTVGVSCPHCGKEYKTVEQIVEAGGPVRALGLALKGRCVCGHVLAVNSAWKASPDGHQAD
jgi:hypothetical protein